MDISVNTSSYGQKDSSTVEMSTEVDRKNNSYHIDLTSAEGEDFEFIVTSGKAFLEDRPGVWKKTAKVDAKEFSKQ